MKNRSIAPMRVAKWGYIALSSLLCVIGVLFILWPRDSAVAVGRALGAAMIAFGAVKIVGYFSRDLYRLAFQYDLEFGILIAVLGIIILLRPGSVLDFIFAAVGIAILADGLFKLRISLDARKFGIPSWWGIAGLAVLTAAAGLITVFLPREGQALLSMWLGISLLSEGVLSLWVAISTVKIIRHQIPDRIDVNYTETGDDQA